MTSMTPSPSRPETPSRPEALSRPETLSGPATDAAAGPFRRAQTMHELFAWCAERWPERTAVRHRGRSVSYGELAAASDAFAAELAERGVGPGAVVPVALPRSAELFAVLLAVLKRGAAYAALDVRWPRARLTELVTYLDGPLVVSSLDGPWPVPQWRPPHGGPAGAAASGRRPAPVPVGPDDPCAVFFTSGTTGTPKGVVTAHRGSVRLFDDWVFAPLDSGVVMPQALSATWDAFALDSWGVLFTAGTLVLLDDTLELATGLRELIGEQGVNTVFAPTAVFHSMVDTDLDAFAGLRAVGVGGEALSAKHAARFLEAHPGIPLYNMYGPAESSVAATYHLVTPRDCEEGAIPLGRPFPHTEAYVLDGDRPCAAGETGEVVLAGAGLALGYFKSPGLTAEKFVELELGGTVRRGYRTGDRGHFSAVGTLYFDGREDTQVKVRGHRIELAEIEQRAGAVPGVGSCAVVPLAGPDGAYEDLCLFYAGASGPAVQVPGPDALRAHLAQRLPGHLVPAMVHRLERLPVREDRKLDRTALGELAAERRAEALAAPGDPGQGELAGTEAKVAGIFREILGARSVQPEVSFFQLGGNSLTAAQLASRIAQDFGVRLRIQQVFDTPTVSGLAEAIDGSGA
ncbi:AMP-binding protein [Streptomyces sp. NPDC001339]|uniref:non-ribosomal peptide synthetase n=1 Tax=Streptomyces sp. NPDC001339 TaxID=3364563 RepID=UPI00368F82A9